tara:strand:- start:3297 stop:3515 length:219 start_codon:yes stop_codon:yes gene_type:complete
MVTTMPTSTHLQSLLNDPKNSTMTRELLEQRVVYVLKVLARAMESNSSCYTREEISEISSMTIKLLKKQGAK